MSTLLTRQDLEELTGYSIPSAQMRWFRNELEAQVPAGADGYPRVTWHVVEQLTLRKAGMPLSVTVAPATVSAVSSEGPRWRNAA